VQYFYAIKNIGHHACLREREHLLRYRAHFEGNQLRFVRVRAHVHAPMTRISCAVGMRNAKLRITLMKEQCSLPPPPPTQNKIWESTNPEAHSNNRSPAATCLSHHSSWQIFK